MHRRTWWHRPASSRLELIIASSSSRSIFPCRLRRITPSLGRGGPGAQYSRHATRSQYDRLPLIPSPPIASPLPLPLDQDAGVHSPDRLRARCLDFRYRLGIAGRIVRAVAAHSVFGAKRRQNSLQAVCHSAVPIDGTQSQPARGRPGHSSQFSSINFPTSPIASSDAFRTPARNVQSVLSAATSRLNASVSSTPSIVRRRTS